MRALLIEDDTVVAHTIEFMLAAVDARLDKTDSGEEGIDLGKLYDYDVILLDLRLPDMSGFEVLRSLRLAKVRTPVLVLSGNAAIEAKVKALSLGADGYMTKPFHRAELIARIRSFVRRSKGHTQSVITTGKLTVDLDTKSVEVAGTPVRLSGKEYELLELLCLHKGTVVTKETILTNLYGSENEPESKILDVFACKLRRKLANAGGCDRYIKTVWSRGYLLRDPEEMKAAA